MNRASRLRGPCVVVAGGQTFFTAGDVKIVRSPKKFPVAVAGEEMERRLDYYEVRATFTPMCQWINANAAVLFPHLSPVRGVSVFGGNTDKPWVFHSKNDASKYTMANAYVEKMPTLSLSAGKMMFGEMTVRGIIGNNLAPATAGSIDAWATETYSYPVPTMSQFLSQGWTAAWGSSSPWNALSTPDGVMVDFNVGFEDQRDDDQGVMDVLYNGKSEAVAKLVPLGITVAQLRAIQNIEVARGSSFIGTAQNLVLTGADTSTITLNQTNVEDDATLLYDSLKDRVGQLTFRTTREISAGALQPIAAIACTA